MSIMQEIILDTNFFMIPLALKVDVFGEIDRICNFSYEICVLDKSIDELDNIIKNQSIKDQKAANFAKELIKTKKIKVINTKSDLYVDDAIIEYARKNPKTIVATQDKELKKRLKEIKITTILLRQKKYLVMER